ncbi:MAG: hypothetical protein K6G85_03905 [Eubacterium sp.]|nr:hypothetical protein [Eubacterium sp.]
MSNEQKLFEQKYKNDVEHEAKFILGSLISTALDEDYETDVFVRHVLNKARELLQRGNEE